MFQKEKRLLSNDLDLFVDYTKKFKNINKIMITNQLFEIYYVSDSSFFDRYDVGFKVGLNILDCLRNAPGFEVKKSLYDQLLNNKKVCGYLVTQRRDKKNEHLVDRINLSPICVNDEFIGVELEAVESGQLPLITIHYQECETTKTTHNLTLTLREKEVLTLKAMGKTNEQVSEILALIYQKPFSQHTIANIIKQQLYPKFNVQNKVDLIKRAHEFGFDKFIPNSLITGNQIILLQT